MKNKLYQICYTKELLNSVPEGMDAWDNTANPTADLCEYPVFKSGLNQPDDVEYWGFVSPKFQLKTGISGKEFLNWANSQIGSSSILTGNTVNACFINPAPILESIWPSVVTQGEPCHPGITNLLQTVISRMGFKYNSNLWMDSYTFAFSNYFIADRNFWKRYTEFVDEFIAESKKDPVTNDLMFNLSANYSRDKNLSYYPFAVERLFSIFLNLFSGSFFYSSYPYSKEHLLRKSRITEADADDVIALSKLKKVIVSGLNYDLVEVWTTYRNRFVVRNPNIFNVE